jgi:hypothetical protein
MAIRTKDIALLDLFEEFHEPDAASEERDIVSLLRGIAMIELHHEPRELLTTIEAWRRAERTDERGLFLASLEDLTERSITPRCSLFPWRMWDLKVAGLLARVSPRAMTVRADDVALRDLRFELGATLQQRLPSDVEQLLVWVAMIEVHRVRREPPSAVHAGNSAQIAKPLERRALPRHHSLDLFVAMDGVIGDVVWALISRLRHAPF